MTGVIADGFATVMAADSPPPPPPPPVTPLSNLDGGTYIGLFFPPSPGGADECTTSFNVKDSTGRRFALTAKHCIDGSPNGDQTTNVLVGPQQPMTITNDHTSGGSTTLLNTLRIATGVNCTPPSSPILPASPAPIVVGKAPGGDCILPSDNPRPQDGDMVALLPDSPTTVSGLVHTGHGLLPVIREETVREAYNNGDILCHIGAGSARHLKQAEHCGFLDSNKADQYGEYYFNAKGIPGDSGGPVYVYKYKKGKRVGVFAVGMTQSAGQVGRFCDSLHICTDKVGFVPLHTVLTQLGVALIQTA